MPFWKKDNGKEKINYKARLEHKQYLVRIYYVIYDTELYACFSIYFHQLSQ